MSGLVSGVVCAADAVQPPFAKLHYGPDVQQYLDFWKAKIDQPTPLVMKIHGGGWLRGPIEPFGKEDQFFLDNGISVAHITTSFTSSKPLPASVFDAILALQFLLSKASKWNLVSSRVVVSGFSAGGCSALWIATYDDSANPQAAQRGQWRDSRWSVRPQV